MGKQKDFSKIISQNRPSVEKPAKKEVEQPVERVVVKEAPAEIINTGKLSEADKRRLWHLGFKYGNK